MQEVQFFRPLAPAVAASCTASEGLCCDAVGAKMRVLILNDENETTSILLKIPKTKTCQANGT